MNKIQSAVLAVVMSVFLIQATDPPYEKPSGSFIQFYPVRQRRIDNVEPKYTQVIFRDNSFTRSIGSFNALDSSQKPVQSTTPGNYVPSSLVPQKSTITNFLSGSNLPLYPPLVPIPNAPTTPVPDQKFAESALPQYPPVRLQFDVSKVPEAQQNRYDALGRLHNYLTKIGDRSGVPDEERSSYEKLLAKELIRPLLKLYEKQIHYEAGYETSNGTLNGRISKEDYVEDFKVLSKEELDMLMYGGEKYQNNHKHDAEDSQSLDPEDSGKRKVDDNDSTASTSEDSGSTNGIRRDDVDVSENNDKEHIGEILPPEFKKSQQSYPQTHRRMYHHIIFNPANYRMRKSYDYNDRAELPRIPVTFPTAPSSEGADGAGYHRVPRLNLPPQELYRAPRRFRGYRESYSEGPPHPYFDPSARYHNAWTARRPRVIFPTDLVAFRDSANQEQEPDWLAGDNNLQDIQEPDLRDRETHGFAQLVSAPTRVAASSRSLLDKIYVNQPGSFTNCLTFDAHHISDHKMVSCTMLIPPYQMKQKYISLRDFTNFDEALFLRDLYDLPFDDIFHLQSIDEFLNNLITELFNKHSPSKITRVNKPHDPWLTYGLTQIFKERDAALSNHKANKTRESFCYYKELRNFGLASLRGEKEAYFSHLQRCRQSKKTWAALESINLNFSSRPLIPDTLNDAHLINDYFTTKAQHS
ncbi:unnamed protein product [Acanthoscelides obtectus]|uniref:Uncharacterized protein n=1 Tax=Acanthoscelides obtectus TaxID=200917 RepID=A0A9P0JKN4_ACAOB|nr:unnamed protein product [Acanthoscelides obtectus]CAK1658107.1 hypothetical protein AOBTE_LOCUS20693 [Acanthoscelides obtectus]